MLSIQLYHIQYSWRWRHQFPSKLQNKHYPTWCKQPQDYQGSKAPDWITLGIRTSCNHKRELYVTSKRNPKLSDHYKKYCKILSSVINEAKKLTYNNKTKKSLIPNKTTWDTVKTETGKTNNTMNDIIEKLQFYDKLVDDYKNCRDFQSTFHVNSESKCCRH